MQITFLFLAALNTEKLDLKKIVINNSSMHLKGMKCKTENFSESSQMFNIL